MLASPSQHHGVVKDSEQEHERRVGAGRLGKESEGRSGDPLPVALAVYGRVLARRPLENGLHEPCGVRYGDTRTRTHATYPRFRRRAFAAKTAVGFLAARRLMSQNPTDRYR